jgi:glycosyltransferase involved in cell wall biosynthesis
MQNVLFISNDAPEFYPGIDKHYTWVPVHGDMNFERLSSLWHEHKPLALYTYGENGKWDSLSKLFNVRKRWAHLASLPKQLDVCPLIFGSMFNTHKYDKDYPLMSIITTSYKSKHKILRPMRSLQNQTYQDWEWIIWDDSEDDETYKSLLELQKKDLRIRVFKAPMHSGYIGEMKRMAGSMVTGSFIVEVDHDDDLHPSLLKWIKDAGDKHPDAGFFYTDCAEITEDTYEPATYGDFFGMGYEMHINVWSEFHKRYIPSYNAAAPNAVTLSHIVGVPNHVRAWRTELYDKIGRHNQFLSVADDYDLILRSFIHGKFCHIRACGYYQYRNRDGNFTFIRNALIQHNTHHIYSHYKDKLPPRDYGVPVKEQWREEAVQLEKVHYEYVPAEYKYETVVALFNPTKNEIEKEVTALRAAEKSFHVYVVGDLPKILNDMKKDVSWWDLKSKDKGDKRRYVERFLHTGGELIFK